MMTTNHVLDEAEARQVIQAQRERNMQEFARIIDEASKRLRCALVGVPTYTQRPDGSWITQVEVRIASTE
jgi:ABC-type transporter Mla subunit MlaD